MERILFVKNVDREGPGRLAELCGQHGVEYAIAQAGPDGFPDPAGYGALVVLGGPASANDDTPAMRAELAAVRAWVAAGKPYLGVCLGLQVLVKAMGGTVVRAPEKELGFRDPQGRPWRVELEPAAASDPLCRGLPSAFPVFQLHGEEVELAGPEMAPLGSGRPCRNQFARAGARAYGLQGHAELTAPMLELWMGQDPDLRPFPPENLRADFRALRAESDAALCALFANFLALARDP